MRHNLTRGLIAASAFAPMAAFAVAPDVTAVTSALTDAGTSIAVLGAAGLVLFVGIKVWKYLRRAI